MLLHFFIILTSWNVGCHYFLHLYPVTSVKLMSSGDRYLTWWVLAIKNIPYWYISLNDQPSMMCMLVTCCLYTADKSWGVLGHCLPSHHIICKLCAGCTCIVPIICPLWKGWNENFPQCSKMIVCWSMVLVTQPQKDITQSHMRIVIDSSLHKWRGARYWLYVRNSNLANFNDKFIT